MGENKLGEARSRLPKLEQLMTLVALYEHQSLVKAAVALHLTPSAVSQQLSKLESEVGVPLLRKHGRGVQLTSAGTALSSSVSRIAGDLRGSLAEIKKNAEVD